MKYPTIEEIDAADREQICRWLLLLPIPGAYEIGKPTFYETLKHEEALMDRISERFKMLGGFTPQISKKIGWHT